MKNLNKIILPILLFHLLQGCGGYNVKPNISAEERLALARRMFENKDYFEAKQQFKILTLNNPGAAFVDEAQFFLAESHFFSKEYILAADEYNRLVRLYPRSGWVDDASYKAAVCDYKLSPKPSLDQTYTVRAVSSFQRFIEDFPNSDLIPEAERILGICRSKLSKKDYRAGELYRKMHDYYAAFVYFDSVVTNYYDTEYAEDATFWKGECLYRLGRFNDARTALEELLRKYPDSENARKARERLETIATELTDASGTDEKAASGANAKN